MFKDQMYCSNHGMHDTSSHESLYVVLYNFTVNLCFICMKSLHCCGVVFEMICRNGD